MWRKHLTVLGEIIYIALAWFASVWFTVAALLPDLALNCGFGAAFLALAFYLFLVFTEQAEGGILIGLLVFFPVIIAFVGVLWWPARWFGLW